MPSGKSAANRENQLAEDAALMKAAVAKMGSKRELARFFSVDPTAASRYGKTRLLPRHLRVRIKEYVDDKVSPEVAAYAKAYKASVFADSDVREAAAALSKAAARLGELLHAKELADKRVAARKGRLQRSSG